MQQEITFKTIRAIVGTLLFALCCISNGAKAGQYDVGIIPGVAGKCPPGSDYISIYMDDEDKNNNSSNYGWIGAFSQQVTSNVNGTRLGFCRVNGSVFFNLGHSNFINWANLTYDPKKAEVGAYAYSLLKLGTTCPNNSKEIFVTIKNEKTNNNNTFTGNILPNTSSSSTKTTELYFCMFTPSSGLSMGQFPDLGIPYGVLGGKLKPPSTVGHDNYWLQQGGVYSDDEDSSKLNDTKYPPNFTSDDVFDFTAGVDNHPRSGNTNFYLAKVQASCNATPQWFDGSTINPYFDGANCFLKKSPLLTSAFVWSNTYYTKPNFTQNCSLGTFDSANCFVMTKPTNGFIFNNGFYAKAGLGNICPPTASFDGANCFYVKAPWGSNAFEYQGNFYVTPLASCPTGNFDGVNCYVGKPPIGRNAFIFDNSFYYQ
jgi:hypothetical protein